MYPWLSFLLPPGPSRDQDGWPWRNHLWTAVEAGTGPETHGFRRGSTGLFISDWGIGDYCVKDTDVQMFKDFSWCFLLYWTALSYLFWCIHVFSGVLICLSWYMGILYPYIHILSTFSLYLGVHQFHPPFWGNGSSRSAWTCTACTAAHRWAPTVARPIRILPQRGHIEKPPNWPITDPKYGNYGSNYGILWDYNSYNYYSWH